MNQVAGMAVTVKASGVSEAIYNGQRDRVVEAVRAEMERQKQAMDAEIEQMRRDMAAEREQLTAELAMEHERADIQQRARGQLLAARLNAVRVSGARRRGPARRVLGTIENAWAMLWAVAHCWAEMGETLGLWEIIREDEEHEG